MTIRELESLDMKLPEEERHSLYTCNLKDIKKSIVQEMIMLGGLTPGIGFPPLCRDVLREISEMGLLFVKIIDGEIISAYGHFQNVPYLKYELTELLPIED